MATTPLVGAIGVKMTVDPQTGGGTLTGTQVYLDGSQPPLPTETLRPDQIAYGVGEVPALVSAMATRIAANNNAATPGDLGQILAFCTALRNSPPAPAPPPPTPTVYQPADLIQPA